MEGFRDDVDAVGRKRKRIASPVDDLSTQNHSANVASAGGRHLKPELTGALEYLTVLKANLDADMYQEFLKIMKDMHSERVHPIDCVEKVKELFRGHPKLFVGFKNFLPKDWDACEKRPDYSDALAFVRKIRGRFSNNDEIYRKFLYVLSMYWTDHKSIVEVYQEVTVLLHDHADLLEEFSCFIPNDSKRASSCHVSSSGPSRHKDGEARRGKMLQKERTYKLDVGCDFSNDLHKLENGKRTKHIQESHEDRNQYKLGEMLTQHEKESNNLLLHKVEEGHHVKVKLIKEEVMDMEIRSDDVKKEKMSENDKSTHGKKFGKDGPLSRDADVYRNSQFSDNRGEILELDLSSCQRCTPSYCLLPENYPSPQASYMTKLDKSVLNDRLVSVTSGSENCTFKFMRRNKYENSLFRCEDDRFEMDLLLSLISSTAKKFEDLIEKFHSTKSERGIISRKSERGIGFQIEDHLSSQDLTCIERVYGDNGLEIIDILHAKPSATLPIILTRLKQKQEETSRKQSDLQNIWNEVSAKYYLRSLDHRSFYFKQQEKKNLSSEALLAECKQVNERRNDKRFLESVAGNGHINPSMVFEYADPEIHNVLHKIMEFYCGENCTSKNELDKTMKIWTSFLEPIFGVLSRFQGSESSEGKQHYSRCSSMSSSEHSHGSPESSIGLTTHLNSVHSSDTSVISTPLRKENIKNNEGDQNGKCVRYRSCADPIDINDKPLLSHELVTDYEDEREEGELSPDENNFVDFEDYLTNKESHVQVEPNTGMDNVNDGDESTQRHLMNNLKAYEAALDASASECDGGTVVEKSSYEHDDGEDRETNHHTEGGSECVDEMSGAEMFEGEGWKEPFSIHHFQMAKPVTQYLPSVSLNEYRQSRIFYGSSSFYLLFRFHQILYERILSAKKNSSAPNMQVRTLKNTNCPDHYAKFKNVLYSYLSGSISKTEFEDDCCAFIGPQSYLLFTLDVLLSKLVKQLQVIASNEMDKKFLQLYAYEKSRGPRRFVDLVYHQNACAIHDGDIFRFECSSDPAQLSIQFMEPPPKETELTTVSLEPDFARYLYNNFLRSVPAEKEARDVFLQRNKRKRSCGDGEQFGSLKYVKRSKMINGLQCRMLSSSKVLYVLGTEDFLSCNRVKKKSSIDASPSCDDGISSAPVKRFRSFLSEHADC